MQKLLYLCFYIFVSIYTLIYLCFHILYISIYTYITQYRHILCNFWYIQTEDCQKLQSQNHYLHFSMLPLAMHWTTLALLVCWSVNGILIILLSFTVHSDIPHNNEQKYKTQALTEAINIFILLLPLLI